MKRKHTVALMIVGLALLVGVGYPVASNARLALSPQQDEAESHITQAIATNGDLTVSVSGVGELVAVSEVDLGFQQGGVLAELLVAPGDAVKSGDILARLQVNHSQSELAASLASAELAAILAQQALDDLYASADTVAAQALLRLEAAQVALQEAQDNSLQVAQAQQALAQAGQAVENAEMQLAILNSKPSEQAKEVAYASLLFKEKELQALDEKITQLEYQIKSAPDQNMKDRLRQQLSRLKINYIDLKAEVDKRRSAYTSMDDPTDTDELNLAEAVLVTAQAQLTAAQKDLAEAQSGPSAGDLAETQVELQQAQAHWDQVKDGPDPEELALAEANLAAARARLALAQQDSFLVELSAPIDGVVVSVDATVGDRIAAGDIITLADISQPMLEISLDESDVTAVQVGYQVDATFDAYPDTSLSGEVVQVYPILSSQNAQASIPGMPPDVILIQDLAGSVRALVRLDSWPPTPASIVPLGLNATVDVISAEAQDVLLVPVIALHELESGGYAVYVVDGSQLELRPVTVGLQDYTSAQIIAGLSAGEAVSLDEAPKMEGEQ